MKSVLDRLPRDAHYHYGFATIAKEEFYETGAYYLDLWPVSGLFLVVFSPTTASEITQENPRLAMERPSLISRFMKPIAGGPNLFDLPEREWKQWRTVFNKGFQSERIMSLVPDIVHETETFAKTLRKIAAKGELVQLDPIVLRFVIDVIGKTIL
jgi:cytochrome P450